MPPVAPDPQAVPLPLFAAFAVPTFFVVLWFMVRVFSGRWITDPKPDLLAGLDRPPEENVE